MCHLFSPVRVYPPAWEIIRMNCAAALARVSPKSRRDFLTTTSTSAGRKALPTKRMNKPCPPNRRTEAPCDSVDRIDRMARIWRIGSFRSAPPGPPAPAPHATRFGPSTWQCQSREREEGKKEGRERERERDRARYNDMINMSM